MPVGKAPEGRRKFAFCRAPDDLKGGEVIGLEPGRVEDDPDLPLLSADEGKFRNILVFFDLIAQLGGDPPQFVPGIAVAVAPEGQGEDRHIVDGALLDQRGETPGGIRS